MASVGRWGRGVGWAALMGLACASGPRPAGPVTGGWTALLAPDVGIAPGTVVASASLKSGNVRAICAPVEWLNPKESEALADPDVVGDLSPAEMRDEFDAYVKAHGKGSKTPPLVSLDGRSLERAPVAFGKMQVLGFHANTLHPWSRATAKESCLTAMTAYEDGSMNGGDEWEVAVITRVLVARLSPPSSAAVDGGLPLSADAGSDAGAPAAATVEPLARTKKGYLSGDGLVWAIQYEPVPRPK